MSFHLSLIILLFYGWSYIFIKKIRPKRIFLFIFNSYIKERDLSQTKLDKISKSENDINLKNRERECVFIMTLNFNIKKWKEKCMERAQAFCCWWLRELKGVRYDGFHVIKPLGSCCMLHVGRNHNI